MRSIPVDQTRLDIKAIDVAPKHRDGVQTLNADNVPVWTVQALVTPTEGKAELVVVNVPAAQSPSLVPLAPVEFKDLTARSWEMNGRSGVSFSATTVRAVSKAAV